ncbi:MAG: aldo/keto reductase [Acidobacteriia bacterium]|nr:aldo/keto reductase [Terriglobia bacterium]
MNCKELSQTDVKIPEIGLGTWNYEGGVHPLRTGIDLGARFIDTAESYGTEEVVGQATKGIRDNVFLATKVRPRHFRRADVIKSAEQSLKRLNTDYIDLYQLHWSNYLVPITETMAAMEELVEMGKIRFIGVSNFSVREIRQAQGALSKNKIVSVQVRYSVVDRTVERDLLEYCQTNRITLIAFSPLDLGMNNIERYDRDDILGQVAGEVGKTRAQVALNWCISHDAVVAIPKANQSEHVRENCRASGWQLEPAQLKVLDQGVHFRQRGALESAGRRLARRIVQTFGRSI